MKIKCKLGMHDNVNKMPDENIELQTKLFFMKKFGEIMASFHFMRFKILEKEDKICRNCGKVEENITKTMKAILADAIRNGLFNFEKDYKKYKDCEVMWLN